MSPIGASITPIGHLKQPVPNTRIPEAPHQHRTAPEVARQFQPFPTRKLPTTHTQSTTTILIVSEFRIRLWITNLKAARREIFPRFKEFAIFEFYKLNVQVI